MRTPLATSVVGILLALPHAASWARGASPVVVRPRAHATQMGLFDFFAGEPEQVSLQKGFAAVSHILLCGAEAGEQAEALKARIDNGDISFEDAAVQFSQCRSKGKLGNLGACESEEKPQQPFFGLLCHVAFVRPIIDPCSSLVADSPRPNKCTASWSRASVEPAIRRQGGAGIR